MQTLQQMYTENYKRKYFVLLNEMNWNEMERKKRYEKFSNNEIMARGKCFSQIFFDICPVASLQNRLKPGFNSLQLKMNLLACSFAFFANFNSHRTDTDTKYNWNCKPKQCGAVQKVEILFSVFFV